LADVTLTVISVRCLCLRCYCLASCNWTFKSLL